MGGKLQTWTAVILSAVCTITSFLFLKKLCLQASVIFTDGKDVKKISYWCIMYDWVYKCSRFETADRWTVTQRHDHSSVILLESIAMLVNAACDVRWSATDLSSALYRFVVLSYTVFVLVHLLLSYKKFFFLGPVSNCYWTFNLGTCLAFH